MLIVTKVEVELFPEINVLFCCENASHSGINGMSGLWIVKTNNKYMQSFKANEQLVFGAYLVEMPLHAGAVEQPLPLDENIWKTYFTLNDILSADLSDHLGFIVEVEIFYHSFLLSAHNDLPVAP